jgi:hypothetical protein
MAIRKVKSRVQVRSRMNQRGKNKKHYTEKPKAKQTNNDASGCTKASKCRYHCFKRYFHQMNPLTGSVYTFSVKSNDPIYDDDSNLIEDTATSFSKRRVLTTDDQTSEGAFKGGLQTVLILCRASNATDRSDAAVRMSMITSRVAPARAIIEMVQKTTAFRLYLAIQTHQYIPPMMTTRRPPL